MAFWSLKPAPLSVLFEVTPEEDWDLPKKKRTKVQVIWRYWVRKLPKLVIVEGKDKNGNRVLCYTDAYFYYTKHHGDELVKEEKLTLRVDPGNGGYTLRVCCNEESGAMVYARMIVAWAFNPGQGPADDFEAFKAQGWEGDHLPGTDGKVPLGRASVVCGWIRGVTRRRHQLEEWRRDAAARLVAQSKAYAACANAIAEKRETLQKEHEEAVREHNKARAALKAAKSAGKKAHIVEQHRVDVEQAKKTLATTAKEKADAPDTVQKLWKKSQYVKDYEPPEPIGFKWESRCGCFVV